jgi:threonine/homoserine/homoserine lactone efflux protein
MLLWTTLPGPGLAVVLSRALASGPRAGLAVITGLVIADLIFLGVAFIGLLALANTMGPIFQVVKYAGAAYLIWRGYRMLVEAGDPATVQASVSGALPRDIGLGLLTTLGNPKAILFFGAILPSFVDMATVAVVDFLILAGIVSGISYFVYGGCVVMADRARRFVTSTKMAKRIKQATGMVLVGSGIVVATR